MGFRISYRRTVLGIVGFAALVLIAGNIVSTYRWINEPFPGFFVYENRAVAPDFLPHWSGKAAGLRFLDRIIAIDNRPIAGREQIYSAVRARPLGSSVSYEVDRGGALFFVSVPTMKFTLLDWVLSYGVYLLVGLGFLAIGAAPFAHRTVSSPAMVLFFMVTAIFLWFAPSFDFMTTQIFPKELRVFAFALTPTLGIHLAVLLTRSPKAGTMRSVFLLAAYGVSILLPVLYSATYDGATDLWRWCVQIIYLYSCAAALVFLGLVANTLRHPISNLERSRLRVMLVGSLLGFFFPTFGTVLASSFQWDIPYNLLLIPTVCFPLSVAFALLKYNLFDIETVLKLGLSRGALAGALLLIYVLTLALLSLAVGTYDNNPLVPLLFSVFVALLFNPLLGWIEGLMDRYLYRREYDAARLQNEISSLLRSLCKPRIAAQKFLRTIAEHMGITTPLLVLQAPQPGQYLAVSPDGEGPTAQVLGGAWVWSRYFEMRRRGFSRDEAESAPDFGADREGLLEVFGQLESELLLPLIFEERLLGLLSLGPKKSGRGYSADDFRLLSTLADQLALSLKNGMLFEESEKAQESYRLLYDQAQALNNRLLEADRIKKQFVANISHELRTPISTILGYTEVLLDPAFNGDSHAILERLVTGGRDLSHLMNNLLDFSRMEAGSMAAREAVDIRQLLCSLETMGQRLAKGRPIRVCARIDAPFAMFSTDAKRLQQILMHLLTNALKFTERGEIGLEIHAHCEGTHEFVEFSVSDTGIGIGRHDQEIIFEDFRQLDGSSTRKHGGTGVGLSLCQKLAQSLGGRIQVASEPGQGSTFSLILPLERGEPARPEESHPQP